MFSFEDQLVRHDARYLVVYVHHEGMTVRWKSRIFSSRQAVINFAMRQSIVKVMELAAMDDEIIRTEADSEKSRRQEVVNKILSKLEPEDVATLKDYWKG